MDVSNGRGRSSDSRPRLSPYRTDPKSQSGRLAEKDELRYSRGMTLQLVENSRRTQPPYYVSPFARWIVGKDAYSEQEYLLHAAYPMFVAKISRDSDAGILSGLSYEGDNRWNFFDFFWFDPFPEGDAFLSLMREAEAALDEHHEG